MSNQQEYNSKYNPFANLLLSLTQSSPDPTMDKYLSAIGSPGGFALQNTPETWQGNTRQKYGENIADALNILSSVSQNTPSLTGTKTDVFDVNQTPDRSLASGAIDTMALGAVGRTAQLSDEYRAMDSLAKLKRYLDKIIPSEYVNAGSFNAMAESPSLTEKLLQAREMAGNVNHPLFNQDASDLVHSLQSKMQGKILGESARKGSMNNTVDMLKATGDKIKKLSSSVPEAFGGAAGWKPSLEEYSLNPAKYTNGVSDEEIINKLSELMRDKTGFLNNLSAVGK